MDAGHVVTVLSFVGGGAMGLWLIDHSKRNRQHAEFLKNVFVMFGSIVVAYHGGHLARRLVK